LVVAARQADRHEAIGLPVEQEYQLLTDADRQRTAKLQQVLSRRQGDCGNLTEVPRF
jgi:hypothetical protein